MERVKKGEKYWYIASDFFADDFYITYGVDFYEDMQDGRFALGNYFHTKEQAESMAKKLSAVLKGADVVEMPSEEEIKDAQRHIEDDIVYNVRTEGQQLVYCKAINKGAEMMANWLKSKIVK